MSDKLVRRFARYRDKLNDAARARKEATKVRKSIKGLGGAMGEVEALASELSTEAVMKELDALKAERRALKKLHAFAVKAAGRAQDRSGA